MQHSQAYTHMHAHMHINLRAYSGRQSYAYGTCDAVVAAGVNADVDDDASHLPAYAYSNIISLSLSLPLLLYLLLSFRLFCRLASTTCMNVFSIFRHFCLLTPVSMQGPTLRSAPYWLLLCFCNLYQLLFKLFIEFEMKHRCAGYGLYVLTHTHTYIYVYIIR